jgi:phage recombination protein Bet
MENNELILSDDLFSDEKIKLMKDTICKDSTDNEFELFLHACKRTGLDPFMKQIHAVKRWDSTLGRTSMTVQTGIDGYRLIAERTKKYSPGREPSYTYDANGKLESATAYVKKMTPDGTWHEISASAYYSEYVQKKKDGSPVSMWANMPRNQLAKCAEALALRKCFPAELSGLYTTDEMAQSVVEKEDKKQLSENQSDFSPKKEEVISDEMRKEVKDYMDNNKEYREKIEGHILEKWNKTSFDDLSYKQFMSVLKNVQKKKEEANVLESTGE